jgi:hypothetical protein
MRKLIGHLVASSGAGEAAARMAADISQQFLCKEDRAERIHAPIAAESSGDGIAIGETAIGDACVSTDSARTDSPITFIYARENFTDDVVDETAGATPSFGVLD